MTEQTKPASRSIDRRFRFPLAFETSESPHKIYFLIRPRGIPFAKGGNASWIRSSEYVGVGLTPRYAFM